MIRDFGSGPSIFALSKGKEQAIAVGEAMQRVYTPMGVAFDIHISRINSEGIKIL